MDRSGPSAIMLFAEAKLTALLSYCQRSHIRGKGHDLAATGTIVRILPLITRSTSLLIAEKLEQRD